MKTIRRLRKFAWPRLLRLEDRLAPAAANTLVSRADPLSFSDSSGGPSGIVPHSGSSGPLSPTKTSHSADGRFVVFVSSAANLVAGQIDTNATDDIFVYDRQNNSTELISHVAGSTTIAGKGVSGNPMMSSDGRFVSFESSARNLVAGMTVPAVGSNSNTFLYDRATGSCQLASHRFDSLTTGSSYQSEDSILSADGSTIVFSSQSVDLVAGFPNPGGQIYAALPHTYAFNRLSGQVVLVDHDANNSALPSDGSTSAEVFSGDSRYLFHYSGSTNLLNGVVSPLGLYRFDLLTGQNALAIKGGGGGENVSVDGQRIAFFSNVTNLITGTTTSGYQVFLYDSVTDSVRLVSHIAGNNLVGGSAESSMSTMSADGRFVTYISKATDLVSGFVDGNGTAGYDVFLYDSVTGDNTLISRQVGVTTASGNGGAARSWPSISANGNVVVFADAATDLIPGFVDGNGPAAGLYGPPGTDLYRYDRNSGQTTLVSGKYGSANEGSNWHFTNGYSSDGTGYLSSDGNVILWTSSATDLIAGLNDTNSSNDLYIRDVTGGTTTLASRRFGSPSLSPGGGSFWVQQSADGRFVVYCRRASDFGPGQNPLNDTTNVYLYDRQTNTTNLVSHAAGNLNQAGNDQSTIPVISRDGRYVAYASYATDLITGFVDNNGPSSASQGLYDNTDVFLYDRITGTNQLVSHQFASAVSGGNKTSATFAPNALDSLLTISDNGQYVGYTSNATNLVPGFVNTSPYSDYGTNIYVFDRISGSNTLVSHQAGTANVGADARSFAPSISGDGRYVAYYGAASNVIVGVGLGGADTVLLYDRLTDATVIASYGVGGHSNVPTMSQDGNYVLFQNTTIANDNVFLYERQSTNVILVSHAFNSTTATANDRSRIYRLPTGNSLSDDGRFVVYYSQATNIVGGFVDNNADLEDVYLFDRVTGQNTLLSRSITSANSGGNRRSDNAVISGDGRFATIYSESSNLIPGYASLYSYSLGDLYTFDRMTNTLTMVTHDKNAANIGANHGQIAAFATGRDGSVITFASQADNIVAGDFNSFYDAFAYVTPPPQVTSLKINDGSPQRSIVRSMTISFDEPVFFSGSPEAAFTLTRIGSMGSVQLSVVSVSNVPNGTVTLSYSGSFTQFGSLIDGNYSLSIDASQVSNIAKLDGNGDGVAGDNWVSPPGSIFRLFGDADGNRMVDAVDFVYLRLSLGGASFALDLDGDGDVSLFDFIGFRNSFGMMI